MMFLGSNNNPWSTVRYGLVFLTWGFVTWNYYSFSHYVHHVSFHRFQPNHTDHGGNHSSYDPPHGGGGDDDDHHHNHTGGGDDNHHHDHEHGRGGSFDRIHEKKDGLFLYGLALPLVLLTLAALVWNPSTSNTKGNAAEKVVEKNSQGEVNVQKWTIIWFVVPLFLVMFDGMRGHHSIGKEMGWDLYIRICM